MAYCRATGVIWTVLNGTSLASVNASTGAYQIVFGARESPGWVDAVGTNARFYISYGEIALDDGCTTIYVSDTLNNRLRKVSLGSKQVTTLAGSGATTHTDGVGLSADTNLPRGIVLSSDGVYAYFTTRHAVRRVVLATGAVTTIAGSGTGSLGVAADGYGAAASFFEPFGITMVDDDTLIVSEEDNSIARTVKASTGLVTTVLGLAGSSGLANGVGTASRLGYPGPLRYHAPSGTLYILQRCAACGRLRKVPLSTLATATIVLSGPATGKSLEQIALDPQGGRALLGLTAADGGSSIFAVQLSLNRTASAVAGCDGGGGCLAIRNGATFAVDAGGVLLVGA